MKRPLILLLTLYTVPVFADTGILVGVGASVTSGLNLSVGYYNPQYESRLLRHFGARLDFASTDPLKSAIDSAIDSYMRDGRDVGDGVKIDEGKLDAWHGALLLDYYPFAKLWRITAGYTWGATKLDSAIFGTVTNAPSQRFYFNIAGDHYYYNGNDFDGAAKIDWNYHGPYLGTGVDIALGCGFGLFFDIGLTLTQGRAHLRLDIPQSQLYLYDVATDTWSPVTIPKLDADIARAEQDANRKLGDLRLYPMLKLGFSYHF